MMDAGEVTQHRLNFSQFNPIATQFDLLIDPSKKLHVAVGTIPSEITGPIQSGADDVGVLDKPLLSQLWLTDIAAGQTGPSYIELSGDPDRQRLQPSIKHIELHMGDGFSDRDSGPVFFTSRVIHAAPDRRFRRTVFVVQCGVAQELVMSPHEFKRQAFSSRNHDTERFQLSMDRVTEYGLVQRRHPHHVRNSMVLDKRSKFRRITMGGFRWDDQLPALQQRPKNACHRSIKREREGQQESRDRIRVVLQSGVE